MFLRRLDQLDILPFAFMEWILQVFDELVAFECVQGRRIE